MSFFIHFSCTYLLLSISCAVRQLSYTTASPAPSSTPITCNDATGCEITCTGDDACNGATITSSSALYLTITASGASVLANAAITCPSNRECTVISTGYLALQYATINCGRNGVCDITGGGQNALLNTDIFAESSTKLITTGDGGNEALHANIHCPRSKPTPSCIIRLRSDSSPHWSSSLRGPIMHYAWIYIDNADELQFQCDANTNWDALFSTDTANPNQIYYHSDTKEICDMTLSSYSESDFFGTNSLRCIYKETGTDYNLLSGTKCVPWPTDSPTRHPSVSPTNLPSNPPTKPPTIDPSFSPTSFPTKFPSDFPTLSPTKPPTNDPSVSPSQYPTRSPTDFPTATPSKAPSETPSKTPSQSPEVGLIIMANMPSPSPTARTTYQRTDRTQEENPESNADTQTLLQMSLVILVTLTACVIVCLVICIMLAINYLCKHHRKENVNELKSRGNNKQSNVVEIKCNEARHREQSNVVEIKCNEARHRENRVENVTVHDIDYIIKVKSVSEDAMNDAVTKEVFDVMHDVNVSAHVMMNENVGNRDVDMDEKKIEIEEHQDAEESMTDITGNGTFISRQNSNRTSVKRDLLLLENMLDIVTPDGILQDEFEVHSDTDSAIPDCDTDGDDNIDADDITEEGSDSAADERHETIGSVPSPTIGS